MLRNVHTYLYFLLLGPDPKPKLRGDARTFRVWLDPNQYQQDMTSSIQSGTEDPYETFNVIMRRKPKENNFKVWTPYWSTQISSHCALYLSALSWDLELWSHQRHPQSDVSHILYSLGYCSCKVGARAALRLPPTQGPPSDLSERHFSLDIHVISCDTPTPLSPLRIPLWQQASIALLSVACSFISITHRRTHQNQ